MTTNTNPRPSRTMRGEARVARHTERLAARKPIFTPSDEWLIATDVNNLSGKNPR